MKNTISNYCIHDVQNVDENTKKLSDNELLKKYIFEVDLKPWHEVVKRNESSDNDLSAEIYNRGLYEVKQYLLKRIQKESHNNMSEQQAFEKFYDYYWKKYKKA